MFSNGKDGLEETKKTQDPESKMKPAVPFEEYIPLMVIGDSSDGGESSKDVKIKAGVDNPEVNKDDSGEKNKISASKDPSGQ